jgi:hypothetical protein
MEIDDQKARERATAFANRKAPSLYKSAERKLMPRKGELSWNFVFKRALARLMQSEKLQGLEKEILSYAQTPYEASTGLGKPRQGFVPTLRGKVPPKGGKW